jgi:hypothetical protein
MHASANKTSPKDLLFPKKEMVGFRWKWLSWRWKDMNNNNNYYNYLSNIRHKYPVYYFGVLSLKNTSGKWLVVWLLSRWRSLNTTAASKYRDHKIFTIDLYQTMFNDGHIWDGDICFNPAKVRLDFVMVGL